MGKYLILCPVGTSFKPELGENEKKLLQELEKVQPGEDRSRGAIDSLLPGLLTEDSKKIWKRIQGIGEQDQLPHQDWKKLRYPSAELQSTLKWLARKAETGETLEIEFTLYPSKDEASRLTAEIFKLFAPGLFEKALSLNIDIVSPIKIAPLQIEVDNEACFADSIQRLFQQYDEASKDFLGRNPHGKVIINTTGGYKSVAGYSLLYGQIRELPCIYNFGNPKDDIVELMALPVGYALTMLDEEMSLLKALGTGDASIREFFGKHRDCLPEWIRFLVSASGGAKPNPIAEQYVEYYKKNRRGVTGEGRNFLKQLPEKEGFRQYISERITKEWGELWLGDQIPETVEHSRRHSKRLMETAANLFRCAEEEFREMGLDKPLPLAILVSSIYLHDIGHTAIGTTARIAGPEGPAIPLAMFPSAVREMHHLLSHDRILKNADKLFPEGENPGLAEVLRKIVPQVCAYHRGYTRLVPAGDGSAPPLKPLLRKTGEFLYGKNFEGFLVPLETRLEKDPEIADLLRRNDLDIGTLLKVTALLRVLDGCDAQADRTVDHVYLEARLERTAEEANFLYECLKPLEECLDFEMTWPGTKNDLEGGLGLEKGSFLSELKRYLNFAASLDPKKARTGEIDPTLKGDIENQSRLLYESIFDRLLLLVKENGHESFLLKAPELQALSLANRIVFKWEQFLHFYKHLCIDFVLPVREEDQIHILVWPNEAAGIRKEVIDVMLGDVEKDINREFECVKDVLEGIQILAKCR